MMFRPVTRSWVTFCWVISCALFLVGCAAPTHGGGRLDTKDSTRRHEQAQDRVNLRLQLAAAYWQRGQFAVAMAEAQQALSVEPTNADALQIIALSHWSLGDRPQAMQAFQKAVEMAPRDTGLKRNLAWFQCSGTDWAAGVAMLEEIQEVDNTPQTAVLSAQCLAQHDVVASATAFRWARQRWPENEVVARMSAEHQWREGDFTRLVGQLTALNQSRFASGRTQELQALAQQQLVPTGTPERQTQKELLDE